MIIIPIFSGDGANAFMSTFIKGNKGTDSTNERVRLPEGVTVKQIYDLYDRERPVTVSKSYFYNIWNDKSKRESVSVQRHVSPIHLEIVCHYFVTL